MSVESKSCLHAILFYSKLFTPYNRGMLILLLLFISLFAGFLGALLGIGGGMIVVPVLTLGLGIDIRYAIAASLISIVATSSGAAASYLRDHLTNLRLAVLLEVGTVTGAMAGFLIATHVNNSVLYLLFGGILILSAVMMFRRKNDHRTLADHPWSAALKLGSSYYDERLKEQVSYKVAHVPIGFAMMFFAGGLSAMLGIGSGVFKVLAMDGAMKLPMKVSAATSNFMIGVTATASAGAYLLRGDIKPEIACPVSIGILIGAYTGAKVMPKMPAAMIRKIFVVVLVAVSLQMIQRGLNLWTN